MRFDDHVLLSTNNFKLKSYSFIVVDLVSFFHLAKDKQINFERFKISETPNLETAF